jgi:hypothetical protein
MHAVWSAYYAYSSGYKKTAIGNCQCTYTCTDDRQFTTLVNSTSAALLIGLLPKMAEFCNNSNRFLVGHGCCHAISRLYFNSSPVDWMLVGRSSVHNKGCRALGGFPSKALSLYVKTWDISICTCIEIIYVQIENLVHKEHHIPKVWTKYTGSYMGLTKLFG